MPTDRKRKQGDRSKKVVNRFFRNHEQKLKKDAEVATRHGVKVTAAKQERLTAERRLAKLREAPTTMDLTHYKYAHCLSVNG